MKTTILTAVAAVVLASQAHASLIAIGAVGGAPLNTTKENFDALALGTAGGKLKSGVTVSFSPDGKTVQGARTNIFAAPYLSGLNGNGFGNPGVPGPDSTPYLTTGSTNAFPGAKVSITFPRLEAYLGLLWGSIDSYNTLSFYNGEKLVGSLTGSNVKIPANGNRGLGGTEYVNITSTLPFDRIVASSTNYAFEFDNLAFSKSANVLVPEPTNIALIGLGLAGLVTARRRRA